MDLEKIIKQINQEYSKARVVQWLDEEILNWIDDDWQEDGNYDNEYEWYADYNRSEAEDVIATEMLKWWNTTYNNAKELTIDEHCDIFYKIKEKYDLQ